MPNLNVAIVAGHLGREAEIKEFPNGGCIASLRIATNAKGKDGVDEVQWHNVTIKGPEAARARELQKGDAVGVHGQLKTRQWQDAKGDTRYMTEIVAYSFDRYTKTSQPSSKQSSMPSPRPSFESAVGTINDNDDLLF